MIFNCQGSAEKRTYISGGEITPGEEDVVLPGGAYLLGDLTIKAVKRYAKELVYIQSNGAQYIDTGFKPDQNTRIKIDLDVTAQSSQSALIGARNGSASGAFCLWTYSNNNGYQDDYGAAQNYPVGGTSSGRHTIEKNKNALSIDGDTVSTAVTATFACNHNVYLFTINSGGSTMAQYPTKAKLYSCQIYDNGSMIRDFIPVVDNNGVACLYDKVEQKLYYNAGSGTFTYA